MYKCDMSNFYEYYKSMTNKAELIKGTKLKQL
jgi:hypothetical protein